MKILTIRTILCIAFILTSCATSGTVISPTKVVQIPTISPIPSAAITLPTPAPKFVVPTYDHPIEPTHEPTSQPTLLLDPEGPWLIYLRNLPKPGFADLQPVVAQFVVINQDGSGRTTITIPECQGQVDKFLMDGGKSINYLVQQDGGLYLLRPSEASGMLVFQRQGYSQCRTYYSGDAEGGLLASIYQAADDPAPELIIYELPSGKIRDRFPLVRCGENAKVCQQYRSNWNQMGAQEPQWSPDGRYLAFAGVLDADSSDLFVYDSQDASLRRLTDGPDWVGPIEWSADGTRIIMQEISNQSEFFFAPSTVPPTSVWSISFDSKGRSKLLYRTDGAYARQNIERWLNGERFIAYEGFLGMADSARNLRYVDIESGTSRLLFEGEFVTASFDPDHATFALYALASEKYQQGFYLVSVNDGSTRPLEGSPLSSSYIQWDPESGLFVAEENCQNAQQSYQAFDFQANFQCVPKPVPAPDPLEAVHYPSPDGKWTVTLNDGLWLEAEGKSPQLISQETPFDIIWCLDSSCLFFPVLQGDQQWNLNHLSLPDLTLQLVDTGIESTGSYQWLGNEE